MQITVYLDLIFIINYLVDFYVLLITGMLLHQKLHMIRIGLGALFGAALLLPCVLYPKLLMGFSGIIISIGISMGAVVISLGRDGGFIRKWFLSTTVMVLFGGIFQLLKSRLGVLDITFYTWLIFFLAGGIACYISICFLVRCREERDNLRHIYIYHRGKTIEETVLVDSGNRLWDYMTGKPVMLLSEMTIRKILSEEEVHFIEEYKKKGYIDYEDNILLKTPKTYFHEISYRSVGKMSGRLLCVMLDSVEVSEYHFKTKFLKKQPCAIADESLFKGKSYKGLLFPDDI